MSIAEFPSAPSAGELGRTPPQDLAAEQSVLGGMLLSKDAIADVVEVVRGHDFYRPAHELVFEAVLDLYGRGEPADAVTVSAELQKRGELGRVGGAPYLHTLLQSVPTAANAGYYARIVRETAVLRRLIEAGTKIVQLGYAGDGDADDIVDAAQVEVYNVTDKRTSEDYLPLSEIMEGALDEIEAIGSRGGEMVGVPTGFADFDELTNGLHPGQMVVVAARPAVGKALALDTPLVTPTGWTTMGEVAVGDRLMGADGHPTTVVAATEVMSGRPCYEVEFADGTVIVADAEHSWLTETVGAAGPVRSGVRTTRELAGTVWVDRAGEARPSHRVRNLRALQLPDADLTVPPYLLGVAVGDAWAAASEPDPELALHLDDVAVGAAASWPAADRHRLPPEALRAAEPTRRALLAGLLDRAGEITPRGCVRVPPLPAGLASDVHDLVAGLGTSAARPAATTAAVVLTLCADDDVFRMESKRLIHKRLRADRDDDSCRVVVDVRRVRSVPVRCVEVDNDDHLYLAGRAMVPTHNSTLGLDIARSAAIKSNMATVHLLAGDEPQRDHDAAAVRGGAGPAAPHAHRPAHRRRLDPAGPADGRGLQRAAVHRRLAQHVDDGDPGQVPATQAAPRPQAGDHRLPAADVERQAGREPPAGGVGVLPRHQAAGQGARGPGDRDLPAQPRLGAAHRQEAADVRPA